MARWRRNHQPHDCLLNRAFRHRSKKTQKLRVTGLCAWNSPVTDEFPAQMASNAENVSIWWCHHAENLALVHHSFMCVRAYQWWWWLVLTIIRVHLEFGNIDTIHLFGIRPECFYNNVDKTAFGVLVIAGEGQIVGLIHRDRAPQYRTRAHTDGVLWRKWRVYSIAKPKYEYQWTNWNKDFHIVSMILYNRVQFPVMFHMDTLQWRHNDRDSVSNHQPHDCLLNRLFRCRSKKTSKLRVTGLCGGNSPVTVEFPKQMASNTENVPIWWRHHDKLNILLMFHALTYANQLSLCACARNLI